VLEQERFLEKVQEQVAPQRLEVERPEQGLGMERQLELVEEPELLVQERAYFLVLERACFLGLEQRLWLAQLEGHHSAWLEQLEEDLEEMGRARKIVLLVALLAQALARLEEQVERQEVRQEEQEERQREQLARGAKMEQGWVWVKV
jgi:hypothetical protein